MKKDNDSSAELAAAGNDTGPSTTETASEFYDRITSCGFAMYGEPALCTCGKCEEK